MGFTPSFGSLIPSLLVLFRLALGVLLIPAAHGAWPRWVFALALLAGTLSDIFDGILARRWGVATALLRRSDSAADVVFYAGVLWAASVIEPGVISNYRLGIRLLVLLEIVIHLLSFIRFRRPPATHSWIAKGWGLLLFVNFLLLLGFGCGGGLMPVTIIIGCVVDLEVIAILLLSDRAAVDVPTVWHAWKRRGASSDAGAGQSQLALSASPGTPGEGGVRARCGRRSFRWACGPARTLTLALSRSTGRGDKSQLR